MTNNKILKHSIFCPSCRKKLMNMKNQREPSVEIYNESEKDKYDEDLRCSRCKSFVGIIK